INVAVPDLIVATVTAGPNPVATGGTLTIVSSIRSIGPSPTVAPASTVRFFLSTDAALDSTDVVLGSRAVPSLTASMFSNASTMVTIPANTSAGDYFVIAVADALNQVTEHDETNNAAATMTPITVAPHDLVAAVVTAPSRAVTGA